MTGNEKLYIGVSKAAWGYFFLYFNINFNTVSLLPSFIGYILFLSAINDLKEEERELSLLRSFAVILTSWHCVQWIMSWAGIDLDGAWQYMDVVISLVNLYFHFQLLTNLASIAAKYQPEGYRQDARLLKYRTIQTVMLTAMVIVSELWHESSAIWMFVPVTMMLVCLIAGLCLMKVLFDLRKCFQVQR